MKLEIIDEFKIDFKVLIWKEGNNHVFFKWSDSLSRGSPSYVSSPFILWLIGPSLAPNSAPLDYGGLIAIGLFLLSLYCFYLHNKEKKSDKKQRTKIKKPIKKGGENYIKYYKKSIKSN